MTTIPGHNIVIQQSGRAHDATHHLKPVQPDQEHLQQQQTTRAAVEQTTVQSSENQGALKNDVNPDRRERERRAARRKKRKELNTKESKSRSNSPDLPGNLLDTVA
ncbi:MAG: hypothetical protein HQK66_00925 [Desulfamplus sp.]|nr:hypothetical protein [Desulfamplus sp.]